MEPQRRSIAHWAILLPGPHCSEQEACNITAVFFGSSPSFQQGLGRRPSPWTVPHLNHIFVLSLK